MGVKNHFYQYKPLNVSCKENAKVPILVMEKEQNGSRKVDKEKRK